MFVISLVFPIGHNSKIPDKHIAEKNQFILTGNNIFLIFITT